MGAMNQKKINELIVRSILDELTEEEKEQLSEWLNSSAENQDSYKRLSSGQEIYSRHILWSELDEEQALKEIKGKLTLSQKKSIVRRVLPYAAVLVIGLLTAVLLYRYPDRPDHSKEISAILPGEKKAELILDNGERLILTDNVGASILTGGMELLVNEDMIQYKPQGKSTGEINKLRVPRGGTYILQLSDGTKVYMNSMSSLEYPVAFSPEERRVKLTGQAYFEVAKDSRRPFVVDTEEYSVNVLGTSFDVKAYADEKGLRTTLASGLVSVSRPGEADRLIQPGEQLLFDKQQQSFTLKHVDPDLYTNWIHDKFCFKDNTLEEIFTELQRWFYVDVEFVDPGKREMTFSGTFSRYKNMETILSVMNEAGINIEWEENTVRIK